MTKIKQFWAIKTQERKYNQTVQYWKKKFQISEEQKKEQIKKIQKDHSKEISELNKKHRKQLKEAWRHADLKAKMYLEKVEGVNQKEIELDQTIKQTREYVNSVNDEVAEQNILLDAVAKEALKARKKSTAINSINDDLESYIRNSKKRLSKSG